MIRTDVGRRAWYLYNILSYIPFERPDSLTYCDHGRVVGGQLVVGIVKY